MSGTENKRLIVLQNIKASSGSLQHNGIGAKDYRWEEERLKSFNDWPRTDIEVDKLASAGFYYLHIGDKVRCVFCGTEVSDWRPEDVPMADHAKWAKHCPFVNNQPVGNVPIHASVNNSSAVRVSDWRPVDDSRVDHTKWSKHAPFVNNQPVGNIPIHANIINNSSAVHGNDECGPYKMPVPENDFSMHPDICTSSNFIKLRPPSFPKFVSYDARMKTFESWPISLNQKLKPKILSEAGFYYTGKADQTICFHCGGGLKDWEETDEPWVEHARWFSKCPYVMLLKGKDFIEEVCGKKAATDLNNAQLLNGSGLSSSTGELEKVQTYKHSAENSTGESSQNKTVGGGDETKVSCNPSSSSSGISDAALCKICYMDEKAVVFLPCCHLIACVTCSLSVSTCPLCRRTITAVLRAFV